MTSGAPPSLARGLEGDGRRGRDPDRLEGSGGSGLVRSLRGAGSVSPGRRSLFPAERGQLPRSGEPFVGHEPAHRPSLHAHAFLTRPDRPPDGLTRFRAQDPRHRVPSPARRPVQIPRLAARSGDDSFRSGMTATDRPARLDPLYDSASTSSRPMSFTNHYYAVQRGFVRRSRRVEEDLAAARLRGQPPCRGGEDRQRDLWNRCAAAIAPPLPPGARRLVSLAMSGSRSSR